MPAKPVNKTRASLPAYHANMWSSAVVELIETAFAEDLGEAGDITSALLSDTTSAAEGRLVARQAGVICGLGLAPLICDVFLREFADSALAAPPLAFQPMVADGGPIHVAETVAMLSGNPKAILQVERTLLNFVQRMSGVASLTQDYVEAARRGNPRVLVCDTRKTLPGWRELDKYAVRCGGGTNHRAGLYDAILIKDNHLALAASRNLARALEEMLARRTPAAKFVEVEVDSLDQFDVACNVPGIDLIMLDNFTPDMLREAVKRRDQLGLGGKIELEASGGVTLLTIEEVAACGVERIAVGALTHSAPALDIGLDF